MYKWGCSRESDSLDGLRIRGKARLQEAAALEVCVPFNLLSEIWSKLGILPGELSL